MSDQSEIHHSPEQSSNEFQNKIDEIAGRKHDANKALEDLIALVDNIVATQNLPDVSLSGAERERQALANAGLARSAIENTLDHLATIGHGPDRFDVLVLKKTKYIDSVMVPPMSSEVRHSTSGEKSFRKSQELIPKLKTLLLLLEKQLGVDIEDDKEVSITTGILRPNMIRSASYNLVEIPSLKRLVLTCDARGNATFVFDTEALDENDLTHDSLIEQTKQELDSVIEENRTVGVRLKYTNRYADNLLKALTLPPDELQKARKNRDTSIWRPYEVVEEIPSGYKTQEEVQEELGLSDAGLYNRIIRMDPEKFGGILGYKQSPDQESVRVFSREQQTMLREAGYVGGEPVLDYLPEGYMTIDDLAGELGRPKATLNSWIKRHRERFGEIKRYRRPGVHGSGTRILSPSQQSLLREYSKEWFDEMPAGYITVSEMAKELGLSTGGVHVRIGEIPTEEFGEKRFRKGRLILSPAQQELLRAQYEWIVQQMPEGFVTFKQAADELGLSEEGLGYRISRIDPKVFGRVWRLKEPGSRGGSYGILSKDQLEQLRTMKGERQRDLGRKGIESANQGSEHD